MTNTSTRPAGASYDTVVIGAGLAGLTAALRLAEAGQKVAVLAKGVGATHLAPPTIDVLGYMNGPVDSPAQALPEFTAANPQHPYRQLSTELLRDSLDWFSASLGDQGYRGSLDENFFVPTAVGVAKPTALVPETMAAGDLRQGGRFVFVGLRGLKDFFPAYLADNLARAVRPGGAAVTTRIVEIAPPLGRSDRVVAEGGRKDLGVDDSSKDRCLAQQQPVGCRQFVESRRHQRFDRIRQRIAITLLRGRNHELDDEQGVATGTLNEPLPVVRSEDAVLASGGRRKF